MEKTNRTEPTEKTNRICKKGYRGLPEPMEKTNRICKKGYRGLPEPMEKTSRICKKECRSLPEPTEKTKRTEPTEKTNRIRIKETLESHPRPRRHLRSLRERASSRRYRRVCTTSGGRLARR